MKVSLKALYALRLFVFAFSPKFFELQRGAIWIYFSTSRLSCQGLFLHFTKLYHHIRFPTCHQLSNIKSPLTQSLIDPHFSLRPTRFSRKIKKTPHFLRELVTDSLVWVWGTLAFLSLPALSVGIPSSAPIVKLSTFQIGKVDFFLFWILDFVDLLAKIY